MTLPDVSVVIPTRNGADTLPALLDALRDVQRRVPAWGRPAALRATGTG